LLFVIVGWVELDRTEEVHYLRLATPLDVLAEGFVHRVLLGPMSADGLGFGQKVVVNREIRRHAAESTQRDVWRKHSPQWLGRSSRARGLRTAAAQETDFNIDTEEHGDPAAGPISGL
jgi:hypothetical protein